MNEKYARSQDEEKRLLEELSTLRANLMELETEYNDVSNEVDETKSELQRLHADHDEKERLSEQRLAETLRELERY